MWNQETQATRENYNLQCEWWPLYEEVKLKRRQQCNTHACIRMEHIICCVDESSAIHPSGQPYGLLAMCLIVEPHGLRAQPSSPFSFFFFTCVSNLFKHSSQFSQVRSFAQEFCLLSTSFFISRFIIIDFNMLAGCVFLYCCIVSLMTLSLSCLMSMYRRGFRLTDKTSGQQRMWRATPHTISCLWMSDGSKPPVVLYIQLNRIYTQCGTYPVEFQINSRSVR